MKSLPLTLLATATVVLLGSTLYLAASQRALEQQLTLASGYQQQLQAMTEQQTRQRLDYERRLQQLEDQLLSANTRLGSVSTELEQTRQQLGADYQDLLQQARAEVAQQRDAAPRAGGPFAMFGDPNISRSMAESGASLYDDYLDSLGIDSSRRDSIADALLNHMDSRYQMLGQLLAGELSPEQASAMFGAEAMLNNMAEVLSADQLALLGDYDLVVREQALRELYSNTLDDGGGVLTGATQERALDVLMEELFSAQNNFGALVDGNGSMSSAVEDRSAAFARARTRLENELDPGQLEQLDDFVRSQSNAVDVVLDVIPGENGQTAIRNMRISVDNLPN